MDGDRRALEFVGTLGVGGFGAVYLANLHGRDRFVRRVAVKVMREGLESTADLVARQKDEARLLGLLAHDGIVQVLDLAEVDGRPAVVMEYVEGVDVAEVLKAIAPERVPLHAALEVVASVAGALDAAFNTPSSLTGTPLRVIHRDIKPANILLTTQGRVKVLDFGVAKADFARDGHTTNGGWGTPRFMSPEQWLGEPYGAPVDIYALGVTLFDLVSDRPWERPPLARATFEAAVAAQLDRQAVPEGVLRIIAAMTAFDPADRPLPSEVREQLEAALRHAGGHNLARFARSHVPAMVEARNKINAGQPLPASVSLGLLSGTPLLPPEVPAPPEPSLALQGQRRAPALASALVFGVVVLLLVVVATSYAVWTLAAPSFADAPPPADALPLEPAVTEAAPVLAPEAASPSAPSEPAASTITISGTGQMQEKAAASTSRPARTTAVRITPTTAVSTPAEVPTPAAATPAPAPTPARALTFDVYVQSSPASAEVWIDGARVGETPLVRPLPAGPHTVELVLAGERSTQWSLVAGGEAPHGKRFYFESKEWRTVK